MTPRFVRILMALSVSALASPLVPHDSTLAAQTATAKLQGHVRDSAGVALNGAHVILLGTQHQALTDSLGFFVIEAIPPGTYNVEAHANGKATSRVDALVFTSGQTVTRTFRMLSAKSTAPSRRR